MKNQKLYFSQISEDTAYTVEYIIDEMKEKGLTEIEVALAERELGVNYFFCKAVLEYCQHDEFPCGNECEEYEPRNGKSGCCKHRGFCYIPGKEFILNVNGKITPKTK